MTRRLVIRCVVATLVLGVFPRPPTAAVVGVGVGTVASAVAGVALARALAGAWPSAAALVAEPRAFARKLTGVTAAAGFEEIVWRWAVLGMAAAALGVWAALAVATAGFALAHLHSVGWPAAAQHVATGVLFAGALVLTGTLAAAVAAHAAYNGTLLLGRESERLVPAPAGT